MTAANRPAGADCTDCARELVYGIPQSEEQARISTTWVVDGVVVESLCSPCRAARERAYLNRLRVHNAERCDIPGCGPTYARHAPPH